jgi:hypothetical protein
LQRRFAAAAPDKERDYGCPEQARDRSIRGLTETWLPGPQGSA